jgi:hypothetical protein
VTTLLYQHRMAIAVTALTVAVLLAAAVTTQLVPAARDAWRSSRNDRARRQAARPARPVPAPPVSTPPAGGAVVHAGADESYGDALATMSALLHLTAEQPTVDETDTGKRIEVTRRHVDDTLVTLADGDKALLAAARERAERTGTIDLTDLWALLDAEDALARAEARAAAQIEALEKALAGVR